MLSLTLTLSLILALVPTLIAILTLVAPSPNVGELGPQFIAKLGFFEHNVEGGSRHMHGLPAVVLMRALPDLTLHSKLTLPEFLCLSLTRPNTLSSILTLILI